MGTTACYKLYAEHHFLHLLPQWLSEKCFVSLCSTPPRTAVPGLGHSAGVKLFHVPHGPFSHQTCGSTKLQEVQAAVTGRIPWRRQACANVSSNSEKLKLADREVLWERLVGSRAGTGCAQFPPEAVSSHQWNMSCSANPKFSFR